MSGASKTRIPHGDCVCKKSSCAFFGREKSLDKIVKAECEKFKTVLIRRYSTCSVSHFITRCRTIFRYAVDAEWIQRNPFDKIAAGSTINHDRQVYVDRELLYKVMAHCRDDYDRLLLVHATHANSVFQLSIFTF